MELSVYNIKGEETGKKVVLKDEIFGIEPNDHAIYLDVKQYLANQRQGTHKSKQRSEMSGSTRKLGRQKAVAAHAAATSTRHCSWAAHACSAQCRATTVSNSTRN